MKKRNKRRGARGHNATVTKGTLTTVRRVIVLSLHKVGELPKVFQYVECRKCKSFLCHHPAGT